MSEVQGAQLLARGVQDVWLSGDPQVSFFRSRFKRHLPFATTIESFLVPLDGKIVLNPKSDLLGYTYLTAHDLTTGALVSNLDWSTVISAIELVIGNQVIATHDIIYINNIQKVLESDTYSKRSATPFQPLGFFFDKQYLPLVALKYTDVRINITWTSPNVSNQYIYKCWSHCVHLGEEERKFFATTKQKLLIPRIQRVPISREPYFSGPLKYIAALLPIPPVAGFVKWVARISGNVSLNNSITAADRSGVYVSSQYINPLTAYNSDGTAFGTTLEHSGLSPSDVCLVKYDTNGFVQWVTRLAGAGDDLSFCITTDSSGIYISGQYSSNPLTAYNRDGSPFVTTLSRAGFYDVFIVKYNTNGFVQWVTRVAGTGYENVLGITTDSTGIYVVGLYISDPLRAYNSDGTAFGTILSTANPGTSDAFIVKYNTNGFVQWVTRVAGAGAGGDYATSITTDSSGFYVTGRYTSNPLRAYNSDGTAFGTILSHAGSGDAFIVKYNTNGFVQWVTRVAGTGDENVGGITTDSSGIYVTGRYISNPLTAYNSDGTDFKTKLIKSATSTADGFIVKYI